MIDLPDLLVLRHGQTLWNLEDRIQGGALDSPLTARGRAQAEAQRATLSRFGVEGYAALTSPQGRAVETAAIAVAPLLGAVPGDPRLREIGVGDWAGQSRADLDPGLMSDSGADGPVAFYAHAPGGEGFAALRARCTGLLKALRGPSILVTHGITSRMLRAVALGLGDEALADLPGGQGVVYHLSKGKQRRLDPGD